MQKGVSKRKNMENLKLLQLEHDVIILIDCINDSYQILMDTKNYFDATFKKEGKLSKLRVSEERKFPDMDIKEILDRVFSEQKKFQVNFENEISSYIHLFLYLPQKEKYLCCIHENYNLEESSVEKTFEKANMRQQLSNMITQFFKNIFFKYEAVERVFMFYEDILFSKVILVISYEEILRSNFIHYDDVENFEKFIQGFTKLKKDNAEFRLKFRGDSYNWFRMYYDIEFNDNEVISVFGVLKVIDAEIKYKYKSERDLLTGLYNKLTTERLVEKALNYSTANSYLIMIDVDNFKAINDNLGHIFGDAVLINLADSLKSIFHQIDIIGRIGGDEFLVYTKHVESTDSLCTILEKICKAFNQKYLDGYMEHEISSSIGVSRFGKDGVTFGELANKVDIAMYQAKNAGKNRYVIYDEMEYDDSLIIEGTHFNSMKRISSHFIDIDICFNLFNVFYGEKNPIECLDKIMNILGNQYDIDRVYIFKVNKALGKSMFKYEWINGKSDDMPALPREIPLSLIQPILNLYDEGGIFYFDSSMEFGEEFWAGMPYRDIKSMLHCSVNIDENFMLTIGFDRYTPQIQWTQKSINTLVFLAKTVGVYLLGLGNLKFFLERGDA